MFAGPLYRSDGLSNSLSSFGWATVDEIDNDADAGGFNHDILNDARYSAILSDARAGLFDALIIAFPCSTFSASRFFDVDPPGPPPIRTATHPDGLPAAELDPEHANELRLANLLLDRVVEIALAAYRSPKQTTIVLENPADRSIRGSNAFSNDLADHGSIFATSAFARLRGGIQLSSLCTFAYCRLRDGAQKYTTLFYTNDAARVLDKLNDPAYQCNHQGKHAEVAGGRGANGKWLSTAHAAYPTALCDILASAVTMARTGDPRRLSEQQVRGVALPPAPKADPPRPSLTQRYSNATASAADAAPPPLTSPTALPSPPTSRHRPSAIPFPNLDGGPASPTPLHVPPPVADPLAAPRTLARQGRADRPVRSSTSAVRDPSLDAAARARADGKSSRATAKRQQKYEHLSVPPTIAESPGRELDESAHESYVPSFDPGAIEAHVAALVFDAYRSETIPVGPWLEIEVDEIPAGATQVGNDLYAVEASVTADGLHDALLTQIPFSRLDKETYQSYYALLVALRADSADAPSNHAEAVKMGDDWIAAESKELKNHHSNKSWSVVDRDKVPRGRHVHKLVWVYKAKRDGTLKARLCVQGCTLRAGIDFDQVFSSTLRHSSARGIFAYGKRHGCSFRSVDFVAAYLQGSFLDGEVVYTRMPEGHVELDSRGRPRVCRIEKPIYGIPQSGRRLQRCIFPWFTAQGLRQLSDSDDCVFVYDDPNGDESFAVGVYVDNLHIAHSTALDSCGVAVDSSSYYAKFMSALEADWDVVDEGPMLDLLGMEIIDHGDRVTLHQHTFVEKILDKYLDFEHPRLLKFLNAGRASSTSLSDFVLPYVSGLVATVDAAVEAHEAGSGTPSHPHLVSTYQGVVGSLMYLTTATRADIAFPVHQLCRCMACPTPELMDAVSHILIYLYFNRAVGLTYDSSRSELEGFSDASWETRFSTSGWVVFWQGAAIQWGSRKQNCVSLSSCESEIVALSEASKDMVYFRKFVSGLDADSIDGPSPTSTDNKGARDISYNPEHHNRIKHIQRRHFYVRDMVEAGELVVPLVSTKDNHADFLTKCLDLPTFNKFRASIMNIDPSPLKTQIRPHVVSVLPSAEPSAM